MPKKNAICALCGARKNLNFANLCKRCNASPEAAKIKGVILGEKDIAQAMKSKRLAEEADAKKESAAEEEATKPADGEAPKEGEDKPAEEEKKD